jgi:hypothetical protein
MCARKSADSGPEAIREQHSESGTRLEKELERVQKRLTAKTNLPVSAPLCFEMLGTEIAGNWSF